MRKTKARARKRSTRKRKTPPQDVMEFLENIQRLERENVHIFPDHPKPH